MHAAVFLSARRPILSLSHSRYLERYRARLRPYITNGTIEKRNEGIMRTWILLAVLCLAFGSHVALGGDTPVKVINLEKLNTAGDEEDPCPAAEGLLFARKGK